MMRLVKLWHPNGRPIYVNPDRVANVAGDGAAGARVWYSGREGDCDAVQGEPAEVAALLSAEPPPVVYVCRECLEAVDTEAGRCAECDAEVVAVSGAESAATLLRWLGEARVERPDDDEMPFGEGE